MKYRMILIDDEAVILRGLKQLVNWESLGIEIVGEAQDGEEALRLIEKCRPDIVLSDIAMPNLNGIELLREISERKWKIKTIFLSGYQEFAYAREAMRYGAVDYLLKPIAPEELEQVINQVVQEIRRERSVRILPKNDSEAEVAFAQMQTNKRKEISIRQMQELLGVQSDAPGAVCAFIQIGIRSTVREEQNKNLIRFEIFDYIQKYLEEEGIGGIIQKNFNACCVMLFDEKDKAECAGCLKKLAGRIQKTYPAAALVGVGEWADQEGKLSWLFSTAKLAMELYFFEEKPYIDIAEVSREYVHSVEEYEAEADRACRMISGYYDAAETTAQILSCVKLLGDIYYGNKSVIINKCLLFAGRIWQELAACGLVEKKDEKEQERFLSEIRQKNSFQSLLSAFETHYEKEFLKIQLLGKNREPVEIVRMKQYIREHFRENLTLEELADYIGMNPSYLSTFFKKETGQNFKAYLTEQRMQEAIRLLNSTNMKSYEIADAVGYKDTKQFREKFKELYGTSPQKYKKGEKIRKEGNSSEAFFFLL